MTFPVRTIGPFQKLPKADRLRAMLKAKAREKTDLAALYRQVYKRDGYRCVACRRAVQPGAIEELQRAHPHHIRPRSLASKAEKHTSGNVATLCSLCHADVHAKALSISGNADGRLTIRRVAA